MLKTTLTLTALALALAAASAQDHSFQDGESLKYSVHYKWGVINADVANAAMTVKSEDMDGRQVFHASLGGRTQKMYKTFFTVVETVDSWFTQDDVQQLKCVRHSREGNYWLNSTTRYSRSGNEVRAKSDIESSRKGMFERSATVDTSTFDVTTMIFRLRNVDIAGMEIGKSFPISFIMDGKVYSLHYKYLGKEVRSVGDLGKIRCLKVGFEVVKGETFSGDSDLYCWFSDDDNRIPVRFSAPLKIGQVKGRLTSFSGLKHDFSSRVD